MTTGIDVDADPDLLDALIGGRINADPDGHAFAVSVLIHWRADRRACLYLPPSLAHRTLREQARLIESMASEPELPLHIERFRVIVGPSALERYANDDTPPAPGEVFRGDIGETRRKSLTVRDRAGRTFAADVYTSIDADRDPHLLSALLEERLNVVVSPHDNTSAPLPLPVIVHLSRRKTLALIVPEHLAPSRLIEHARVLRALADAPVSLPYYVTNMVSVVGTKGLESVLDNERNVPTAVRTTPLERATVFSTSRTPPPREDTIQLGLGPRERVGGPFTKPHETNTALYLIATAPERFPGAVNQKSALSVRDNGTVLLSLRLSAGQVPFWAARDIRLLVQLHNLDVYPLVTILLVALSPGGGEVEAELFRCLDIQNDGDRHALDALARRFTVTVALYNDRDALYDAARFAGPLDQNVREIIHQANRRVGRAGELDWAAATKRFSVAEYPRIGTMRHPFSAKAFSEIATPGEAVLAAGVINYWSQSPNQRYLLFNQSFSRAWFEQARSRVIDASLRFGIRLPSLLRKHVAREESEVRKLIERQLANFAEVQLRLKANDLDPFALWDNWRVLLEDAEEFDVAVDPALLELARRALAEAKLYEQTMASREYMPPE